MAETFTGTLDYDTEKKEWRVRFVNRKGKELTDRCELAQLSADLPKDTQTPIQVEFERDQHGHPLRVRLPGKAFAASRPAAPPRAVAERRTEESGSRIVGEFHNPYNFVPAVPRDHLVGSANDLGDKSPAGHHRFRKELYTGRLRVRMTTVTPLLLPDTARVRVDNCEHKTFPVRVAEMDGKEVPLINPTAIKGMLRAAYEAVTNSRLSVFAKHDERLAYRMESTEGAMSVPSRIENGNVILYTGTTKIDNNGKPSQNGVLCAAWLPTYNKSTCRIDGNAVKVTDENRLPRHGEEVWAWLEMFQHYRWDKNRPKYSPDFQFWRVRTMAKEEQNLGNVPTQTSPTKIPNERRGNSFYTSLGQNLKKVLGYVCITAKNDGQFDKTGSNIESKHDERLFFNENNNPFYQTHGLSEGVIDEWDILIKNYRTQHDNGKGGLEEAAKAKGGTILLQWSRHIRDTAINETSKESKLKKEALKDQSLCYARVKLHNGKYQVLELYPVTISRRLHITSPAELLPNALHPAQTFAELSPADRVFGWVRQPASKARRLNLSQQEKKRAAYRGQVRIGVVACESEEAIERFEGAGLPLAILGQPKPQQGRFYVAMNKQGEAQQSGLTNERAGYNDKDRKGLRGRKVYPHHESLPDDYWSDPTRPDLRTAKPNSFREYRRPPNNGKERDSQNRSVTEWVKPGVAFAFDIHFVNLSAVELGALLWLLQLPEKHYHRFGGGKPLGFGSVRLTITLEESDIQSGQELAENRYASLNDDELKCYAQRVSQCVEAFQNAVASAYSSIFLKTSFVKAFLQASCGFDRPIHYPRITPDPKPEGESFKWFVENNSVRGDKLSLANLSDDVGLPLNPKPDRKRPGR